MPEKLTITSLRLGITALLVVSLLVAIAACGPADTHSLPEELLGRWYLLGSGGGIEGKRGFDKATGYIVLHRNRMDVYDEGGTLVRQENFSVSRGKTIYSDDKFWMLNIEGNEAVVVLTSPDQQTMSLNQNAYDGIGRYYARTR